jgi:hypothetical protein
MKEHASAQQAKAGVTADGMPVKKPGISTTVIDQMVRDAATPGVLGQKGIKFRDEYALVHDYVRTQTDLVIETEGSIKRDQVAKIIDEALISGEVLRGHWFLNDPNMMRYQAAPDQNFAPFPQKGPTKTVDAHTVTISQEERERISRAISLAWGPEAVTEANIRAQYEYDHKAKP